MSSWPATLVDWGVLTPQLRAGDAVCVVHGQVDVEPAPVGVPVCAHCHQMVLHAYRDDTGVLRSFIEPSPSHCTAVERHPLGGGRVRVGWTSCLCARALPGPGGHRIWVCVSCTELGRSRDVAALCWPPHCPELP